MSKEQTPAAKESYGHILNQLTEKLERVCRIDQEPTFVGEEFFERMEESLDEDRSRPQDQLEDIWVIQHLASKLGGDLGRSIADLCKESISKQKERISKHEETIDRISGHGSIYFNLLLLEAMEILLLCGLKGRERSVVGAALLVYGGFMPPDYFGLTPNFNVFDLSVDKLNRIHNFVRTRRKRTSIFEMNYEEGMIYWNREYRLTGEIPPPFLPPGLQIPKIKLGSILPNARRRPSR
jgi:hypothetical protein